MRLVLLILLASPVLAQIDSSIPLRGVPSDDPIGRASRLMNLKLQMLQQQQMQDDIRRRQVENPRLQEENASRESAITAQSQQATPDPFFTLGRLNGRFWRILSGSAEKLLYLNGSRDAFLVSPPSADTGTYFPQILTVAEFSAGIDRFYEEPANRPIPIIYAMGFVTMKADGVDPIEISKSLARTLRLIADPRQPVGQTGPHSPAASVVPK